MIFLNFKKVELKLLALLFIFLQKKLDLMQSYSYQRPFEAPVMQMWPSVKNLCSWLRPAEQSFLRVDHRFLIQG